MQRPEFEIVINKTGQVTATVMGVKGARCLEYAELLKQIVGHEERRELTAEYYVPDGQVRIQAEARNVSKS